MTAVRRVLIILLGLAAIAAMAVVAGLNGRAMAATVPSMAGKLWLVKANDAKVIGEGTYAWTGCGITTDPAHIARVGKCEPGQDPIYASWFTFAAAVKAGHVKAGQTVIYDQEGWSITSAAEHAHPWLYLRLFAQLGAKHHITVIEAPVGDAKTGAQRGDEIQAARYAPIVDLQDQYLDGNPAAYAATVGSAVTAMRRVNPRVVILAGLAPDAGGTPVTAADMVTEFTGTESVVQGYWLNADEWAGHPGCAPEGCGATVRVFLAAIGGVS